MSDNAFTLDDLRAELEREYAPFTFRVGDEAFVLASLMREDKETRRAVTRKLKALEDAHNGDEELDEDAVLESLGYVFAKVTRDGKGRRLMDLLGGDILVAMKLLEKWVKATQPGEANGSPN